MRYVRTCWPGLQENKNLNNTLRFTNLIVFSYNILLIKRRVQYRCFLVNFAQFLTTRFHATSANGSPTNQVNESMGIIHGLHKFILWMNKMALYNGICIGGKTLCSFYVSFALRERNQTRLELYSKIFVEI